MKNYRDVLYAKYNTSIYTADGNNAPDLVSLYEGMELDYAKFLPKDKFAAMLDVGCGMGYLIRYFRHKGFENIQGIDHSSEQVDCCLSAGLPVTKIDDVFQYLQSKKNMFDFIVMSDVLEHFNKNEVMMVLEDLRGALKVGGVLILRVPNMSSLYGLHARYLDFTHEVGFTESSLKQVLICSEFRNITIQNNKIPFSFAPKRLARWILYFIWRKVLNFIFLIEVGEDRPKLFGKTLISVAIK